MPHVLGGGGVTHGKNLSGEESRPCDHEQHYMGACRTVIKGERYIYIYTQREKRKGEMGDREKYIYIYIYRESE